jgi:hypothetical protein
MPGPWVVIGGWCWQWGDQGGDVVLTWVAEVVSEGSMIEIGGVEFDGSGGGVWVRWQAGRLWWQIALGSGAWLVVIWDAELVVIWDAEQTLGGGGCCWMHQWSR